MVQKCFFPENTKVPIVCINNPGFFSGPAIQNASNYKNESIEFYHTMTLDKNFIEKNVLKIYLLLKNLSIFLKAFSYPNIER